MHVSPDTSARTAIELVNMTDPDLGTGMVDIKRHEVSELEANSASFGIFDADLIHVHGEDDSLLSDLALQEPASGEWLGAEGVLLLDPKRIAPSAFGNRHVTNWHSKSFNDLKAEIKQSRVNTVPIKIRPSKTEGIEFEIVYGHRRHRACHDEGLKVAVLIEDTSDLQLVNQMAKENSFREDLCPYEKGRYFQTVLDKGIFGSARQLAHSFGCDHSLVSKLLVLANLPQSVVDAFGKPQKIRVAWGAPLRQAALDDQAGVLRRAAEILAAKSPTNAEKVFDRVRQVTAGRPSEILKDRLIKGGDGQLLATIVVAPRAHGQGYQVNFEKGIVDVEELETALRVLLLKS